MKTTRPILVSGFEPFGGEDINPSAEVARALHGRTIGGVPIVGVVLPCVFGVSIAALRSAIDTHRPQLVLALGQAAGRDGGRKLMEIKRLREKGHRITLINETQFWRLVSGR